MLIAEIEKKKRERIRVSIEEYMGSTFIDCRVYFQDESGQWHPTKKGIALAEECIGEVIDALEKARSELG